MNTQDDFSPLLQSFFKAASLMSNQEFIMAKGNNSKRKEVKKPKKEKPKPAPPGSRKSA
ncbi:MAG: hypothetical protein WCS31_00340 [Verrucomicrobiae bacterium]